jgi:selenide,water dikinase
VQLPDDYPLWKQQLLTDPQTSGGLLISCAPEEAERLLNSIHAAGYPSASIIGKVTEGAARVTVKG